MSDAQIAAAAQAAKERKLDGYVIPLQNTTQQPNLRLAEQSLDPRRRSSRILDRAERGGANDTRATIARLAQLRAEKAKLLGFPNYAAWKLEDQMAKTPDAAHEVHGCAGARRDGEAPTSEAKDIQALIDAQKGGFQASRGTGTSTPSRCARRSTTSMKRRSSPTSS